MHQEVGHAQVGVCEGGRGGVSHAGISRVARVLQKGVRAVGLGFCWGYVVMWRKCSSGAQVNGFEGAGQGRGRSTSDVARNQRAQARSVTMVPLNISFLKPN